MVWTAACWSTDNPHPGGGAGLYDLRVHRRLSHRLIRREGVAGLLPAVPKRARRTHPELQTLIEGLALSKPKLSIAAITRKAQAKATQQGWPMVSYSTVRAIITALDPGMVTLAHQGSAAYRDNYEMAWRHRAEQPNATWQADHTELDIVILNTNQQPVRPWMTSPTTSLKQPDQHWWLA